MPTSVRKLGLVGAACALALMLALAWSSRADALSFGWNCNFGKPAYATCNSGSFHSWVAVAGGFGDPLPSGYDGFCLKAESEAGTVKQGSTCYPNGHYFEAIGIAPSPISSGYYYFGGSGVSYSNAGSEST
jgi:hypothetical protein